MNQDLAQQAIDKALLGHWKEAKEINLLILKQDPRNIEALNRLSKTYFELGNIKAAKATINKILKIDSYNPIALKCFHKWKNLIKVDKNSSKQLSPEMFLEEPGRTKLIHLIHLCDEINIAKLNCGDTVCANTKSQRVSIVNDTGEYIGKLPDDISIKIKNLMKLGYQYIFTIKSADINDIKVFIRETFRPEIYSAKSSFSSDKIDYIPYTPAELVHEKIDVSTLEDESENISMSNEANPAEEVES